MNIDFSYIDNNGTFKRLKLLLDIVYKYGEEDFLYSDDFKNTYILYDYNTGELVAKDDYSSIQIAVDLQYNLHIYMFTPSGFKIDLVGYENKKDLIKSFKKDYPEYDKTDIDFIKELDEDLFKYVKEACIYFDNIN